MLEVYHHTDKISVTVRFVHINSEDGRVEIHKYCSTLYIILDDTGTALTIFITDFLKKKLNLYINYLTDQDYDNGSNMRNKN